MKAFFLFFILSSQLLAASPLEEKLTAAYVDRFNNGDLVGLAMGVISPEESLQLHFGEAKESSRKAFEIGSISKTFTGIAIGKLATENKLDINVPISAYIPELSETYAGSLTIKQVGTHTGKLTRDLYQATEGKLISFLQTYKPEENFPTYQYSNLGFCLLTLIIERVTHESYQDYVQKNILAPVGMTETGFLSSENDFLKIITPHNLINEVTVYDKLDELNVGSGGIYSPLKDMMKFLKLTMNPSEVPSLTDAINLSHRTKIGWDTKEGQNVHWKNGGMKGFSSFLGIMEKTKTGTIVLNNTFNGKVTQDMALIALGYNEILKKEVAPSIEFKKSYLGTYRLPNENYTYELVERRAGHLGIRVVQPNGELDYGLKILSTDGITFKLATAWQAHEDVIFAINPESGKVTMTITCEHETNVYYK